MRLEAAGEAGQGSGRGPASPDAPSARARGLRRLAPVGLTGAIAFAAVVYLALRGGGYLPQVYSQAAIAVWAATIATAFLRRSPAQPLARREWVALGLFAAFVGWTALGIPSSDGVERSLVAFPLVALYFGVFALGLLILRKGALAQIGGAIAAAIAIIALIALLSRLRPEWFPHDQTLELLPDAALRLKYPLGSWNGLGSLVAIGIPLLLAAAAGARRTAWRVAAAAAIPVCALTIYYTISRGSIIAAAVGVVVMVGLHPRRLAFVPTLAVVGAGCGALVAFAAQREELANLAPGYASQQGEVALATLLASTLVGAGIVAVARSTGRWELPSRTPSKSSIRAALAVGAIACVAVAIAVGLPGALADAVAGFTAEDTAETSGERLTELSGNLRFQQWEAALAATGQDPVLGVGFETFEYWWAREGTAGGFSRYAHSLYLQTAAETGVVGLLLIAGLIGMVLVIAARSALSARGERRAALAGIAGFAFAFAFAMGLDWGWFLPVLPVAFLIVAAALLRDHEGRADGAPAPRRGRRIALRLAVLACGIPAIALSAGVWRYSDLIESSREGYEAGDLDAALEAALEARGLAPFAGAPRRHQALALERQGELAEAEYNAGEAAGRDPNNWENWFILSRIEERRGDLISARMDYERAEILNPRSELFLDNESQSALIATRESESGGQ